MIIVRITINSLAEKHTEVMQTLMSMIEPTENRKGCLSCHLLQDVEDKNVFSLIQEWEIRQDLDDYIKSDSFSVTVNIAKNKNEEAITKRG